MKDRAKNGLPVRRTAPRTGLAWGPHEPATRFSAAPKLAKVLAVVILALFGTRASAEELQVTIGAVADLAVTYGPHDLTGNAKQGADTAAPRVVVAGFDFDGLGDHDDTVEVEYAVTATGGDLARLAQGYRLDAGYALEFEIVSSAMVLGTGKTMAIQGRFVSATGNNRGASFVSENDGQQLLLKSTSTGNNRARGIVATFDIPEEASRHAAPLVIPADDKPVMQKQARERPAATRNTTPAWSSKAASPRRVETESLLLPRLFCDNMILQQETKNTFWGWAKPYETITVEASWDAKASTQANAEGKWKLLLDTPRHGVGHSLTIRGERDTVEIGNVAIGEVWLCAGQSNMGWSMGNSFEAEKEADVDLPNLRIFKSAREHWHTPLEMQRDRLSQWKPCNPASAAETSAVSYYFAKKLHEELGIPVGIIQQAFAGTPIEGWMPWEIQKGDPRARAFKAELDERATRTDTPEDALAAFEQALAEYNAQIDAGETMKNAAKPVAPPIITKPANLGHQYPGHQFNAMIYPIRPYGIRGVIWYQGERNSKDVPQAANYRGQLAMLINYYRASWHELSEGGVAKDFPFQFTQLPSWTPPQTQPVEGLKAPWAVTREMMRLVTYDVPNTAMAVSIDTGDAVALHPKNKKPLGLRHAYLALKQTYGRELVANGPRFRGQEIQGNSIVLRFDSVGGGVVPARPGKLDAFAIAGKDRAWHWAKAVIQGDTVVVSSPEVPKPVAVRYAWAMNPSQRNLLYNREGIPASPFRTDDWPLFDPSAEIVTVEKPVKPEGYESIDWKRPEMMQ